MTHSRRLSSAEGSAVVQGEAAGRRLSAGVRRGGRSQEPAVGHNNRHVLQVPHYPVPAAAATLNQAMSHASGRRRLAGEGPGAAGAGETTALNTGRRLAGEGPGAAGAGETTALNTGRRLAGEGPGAAGAGEETVIAV